MSISDVIKKYREEHGITMQQLADRSGLSKGYISMLEKGRHPQNSREIIPSIDTVHKLAVAMNMSIDALLELCGSSQLIEIPAAAEADSGLSSDEKHLLDLYRSLNQIGQRKVLENLEDLASIDKYIKNDQSDRKAV